MDDLFRLAIRFAQRLPHKFYCEPVANELFQGAIVGLELDHVDANRSVSKFVLETIDAVRKNKVWDNFFNCWLLLILFVLFFRFPAIHPR